MNIFDKFSNLPCATSENNFTAIPLSTYRKDFLAKGFDGTPIFLLHDASKVHYSPGVKFRYLTAMFHATCKVHTEEKELYDQFALVSCDAAVTDLHEIFVRCFSAAIEELPINSGTRELNTCIQKLVDLFRSLSQPSGKDVLGLWGELYVIANSSNVVSAMTRWHENPFDRFDFSWEQGCLEVKASMQSTRIHTFTLEQLMNPIQGIGYIVSLMLQPLSGGLGLIDLGNQIEMKLTNSPVLKQKLWNNLAKALGNDFSEKLDKRFDVSHAERNAIVFMMNDVPKPEKPSDQRIISIRFTVDLTTATSSLKKNSFSVLKDVFL
ncbi:MULTISPECIES: PD-(D/E)XK motif protein [Pantoea]|uniref:PD-(D/E)XK motif protein n=1 Tax=Pantoea TaxID=53335 RepID=UPI00142DA97D|nr:MULTISPECIES: PD-(D/E)XK motif protein [Pantoea]KAF6674693.1 PD-(D/E)XK motif protein [Pantoea sp. EKM21T]KAF6682579.1 PD-(D/E)XK motif protein [Pantoea sp. EKM22T]MBD8158607.1 PD-(D/E)XK motif protein [Pantoea agglomerans]MBD8230953.1 PD-(D/E)XK motif protein [Pantoea agglomerans]